MLAWGMKRPQATPAFGIPIWVPQLSLVVGSVGCLFYGLRDSIEAALSLRKDGEAGQ